jgi:hypothetical protein
MIGLAESQTNKDVQALPTGGNNYSIKASICTRNPTI